MSPLSTLGAGRRAALLLCLAALAAAALRLPGLAERPMHADEAVLADKLGTLLEKGEYRYDPEGYHGPALLYLGLIPARLAGVKRYADLDESLLRFTPAVGGILLAATPLLLAPAVGWIAAGWAALLLAVSTSFVYYSRYFIPEMLLALFTALFLAAGWRWLGSGALGWAVAAGASAGLMTATKETAVLALASALAALTPWAGRWKEIKLSQLGVAVLAGVAVASVFLSSFGQNPAGPWDYLRSYFATYLGRGLEPGPHSHPWHYYFGLLLWFRNGAGPTFMEAAILALAAAGAWTAWRSGRPFLRFLLLYAALLATLYSLIPYKTPWCLLSFHYALILLAGGGAARLLEATSGRRASLVWVLLAAATAHLAWQSQLAAFRYAADPRNPWVYAHTTPDVFRIRDRLEGLASAHEDGRAMSVQIISNTNPWPLPWYLRRWPNLQWWTGAPAKAEPAPVVLSTAELEPAVAAWLYESRPAGKRELYMRIFHEPVFLRPGVEIRGYAAKSLWDRHQAGPSSGGPAPH
ncbi:MAG: TIGR03663 family protein [Bryobacteraceae bacterium]|nr:TIGR03663 family protein [Bryobacteraceae bacterium]